MEQNPIDFKVLSQHLRKGLSRVRRLRRVVRCLTVIVYTATLCWFAFCLFGSLLFNYETADYETSMNNWKYIMFGFIAFYIFHYAFMKSFNALNRQENGLMAGILAALFPSARYAPTARMDLKALENSRVQTSRSARPAMAVWKSRRATVALPWPTWASRPPTRRTFPSSTSLRCRTSISSAPSSAAGSRAPCTASGACSGAVRSTAPSGDM